MLWDALGLAAVTLLAATALYTVIRWRRAPTAFRAICVVAVCAFASGVLGTLWASHVFGGFAASVRHLAVPAESGKVSALAVGKAILLSDEKHTGDPNWIASASDAESCDEGVLPADSHLCRAAHLARHAIGKDLSRGPQQKWLSLDDVADLCDESEMIRAWKRAYSARNARLK